MDVTILFTEETHEYLVNNKKAKISVTSLIDKQISKTNFASIDPVILANAAARGTRVHRDLELFVKDGTVPTTPEAINFKLFTEKNGWEFTDHLEEFKLALEWTSRNNPNNSFILAGTADLITNLRGIVSKDSITPIMVDHKTTSVIHTQDVRWQLSLLNYMARALDKSVINGQFFNYIQPTNFYVFHFNKQAQFEPIEVTLINDIEIERLLDAEADGEEYHPLPTDIITPRQQEELLSIEQQIAQLEQTKKVLELKKEKLKQSLIEGFILHPEVTSIKTNSFSISFIQGSTASVFDASRYEEEHPEEASKYRRDKVTKPQVRITLNKSLREEIPILATGTGQQLVLESPPVAKKGKREKAKKDYFN